MKQVLHDQSRRHFLKQSLISASMFPLTQGIQGFVPQVADDRLKVHIFSKHLQFLNYNEMSEAAADMGFAGIDLTVRPKGHVEPNRVDEDLPKVAEAFKKAGFSPLLMTTAIEDAANPVDKKLLETASKLGFKYYRMNWYPYEDNKPMQESIELLAQKVTGLGILNRKLGITGMYQNHAGTLVGSNLWEIWELIKNADKEFIGAQFDIRHAMVEGFTAWPNGFRLLQSRIKSITLKDFKWQEKDGTWTVQDTPVGEGLIDFKSYFKLLKQSKITGPFTLHMEHPIGGAEHGNTKITIDKKEVFKAMKKDLQKIQELWQQA
jgi:L-ribulose-5-phosphate 3-epimerase